jgi:hypothetical protein
MQLIYSRGSRPLELSGSKDGMDIDERARSEADTGTDKVLARRRTEISVAAIP